MVSVRENSFSIARQPSLVHDVTNLDDGTLESQSTDKEDDDTHAVSSATLFVEQEPLINVEAGSRREGQNRMTCRRAAPIVFGVTLATAILTFTGIRTLFDARHWRQMHGEEGIVQYFAKTESIPGADHQPLCDKDIVAKACTTLNRETQEYYGNDLDADLSVVHRREIMELFMTSKETVNTLLQKIGASNISPVGSRAAYKCMDLCVKLVNSVPAGMLPSLTNVACLYRKKSGNDYQQTECNIDVGPHVLKEVKFNGIFSQGPGLKEIPHLESPKAMSEELHHFHITKKLRIKTSHKEWEWQELRMKFLNLFKIFPPIGQAVDDELMSERRLQEFNLEDTLRLAQTAKAYGMSALERMANQEIPHVVNRWYGNNFASTREEIKRVLNGVNAMLDWVTYVYPGEYCAQLGAATLAYVVADPQYGLDRERWTGKYIFYICPRYVSSSDSGKIETLFHEGAHHLDMGRLDETYAPVNGDRVLYGRKAAGDTAEACCDLSGAPTACEVVLKNAENFCFFAYDAHALDVSTSDFAKSCCGEACESPDSMIGRVSGSR